MKTTVMFKTDKKLKEATQRMAKKMGIPFSAVMNQIMKEIVSREQVTFSVEEYNPTPYLKRILKQGDRDIAAGKVRYFSSVDELFADLNT